MKFISWNVNGLRACVNKGFLDSFYQLDADFFCLQETKLQEGQIQLDLPGYYQYWSYAEKKGYSGTAIFTKHKPLSISYGLGVDSLDTEGRLITLEYQEFFLVNCYTPNAQRELARIDHRMAWEKALREHLLRLDKQKPVIYCGDLNVAHQEIDLKNPSSNRGNAGFSDQERAAFSQLLDCGFTDSFRYLYPDTTGAYSWWSYMFNARKNNAGWRIDYFVVSDRLCSEIADSTIHPDVFGSDHCPVGLDINTTCNGGIWSPHAPRSTQETNSTDKKSLVGAVSTMWGIGVAIIAILGIMISGFALQNRSTPAAVPDTPSTTAHMELISDIWYTTEKLDLIEGTNTRFQSGSDVWFPVEPVVPLYAYDRKPTFCAVITFGTNTNFTEDSLPQLHYKKIFSGMSFHEQYLIHQFFYGSDGRVAGCLLFGDVAEDQNIRLIVQYRAQVSTTTIQLSAETDMTDYAQYTTQQLVNQLTVNSNLTKLRPYGIYGSGRNQILGYDINYFMTHDPVATELLKREDAVDTMVHTLGNNWQLTVDPTPNILILLEYSAFFQKMRPEQLEKYLQLKKDQSSYLEEINKASGVILREEILIIP